MVKKKKKNGQGITPDKALFQPKSTEFFFLSYFSMKNMFSWRNKENIIWMDIPIYLELRLRCPNTQECDNQD